MKRLDINYEYYFSIYNCGQQGELGVQDFERYICRAERELEGYCSTITENDEHCEAIRLCLCEIAEILYRFDSVGSVKSESIDGYSVTYSDRGCVVTKIRRVILRRLGNTGLLFAGVE